jgi:lipoprotein-anchoring transpeptidase ErfK/SrfK
VLTSARSRLAPAAGLIAIAATAVTALSACTSSGPGGPPSTDGASSIVSGGVVPGSGSTGSATSSTPPPSTTSTTSTSVSPTKTAKPKTPVHIRLINSDGVTYGVGMPVIAFFSRMIKNAKPLQDATTVTVNGTKMPAAWYFERSSYDPGYPIEAHLRLQNYWPAHANVHVDIPAKGLSAGGSKAYDDSLTLDFSTGARNISTVNDSTHTMTVTSDGKTEGTYPVSLGADTPDTRTFNGIKVIMEQVPTVCMQDVRGTYHECGIKDDQRVTYSGEYLHAAPWNCTGSPGCIGPANNIGSADSSNGCTNLRPDDAVKLYHFFHVGDVVSYPDANGPAMTLGAGYGDWNVSWGEWQTGGLVRTT